MGHGQEEVIDVALATAVRTDTWLVIENLQLASRLWLEQLYNRLSRLQLQAGAYYFDVGGERMVLKVRLGGRSFYTQSWTLWIGKRKLGSVCMVPEWLSIQSEFRSKVNFAHSCDLVRVAFAPVKYVCATRVRVYDLRFKIRNRVRFQFTLYQNLYRNDTEMNVCHNVKSEEPLPSFYPYTLLYTSRSAWISTIVFILIIYVFATIRK